MHQRARFGSLLRISPLVAAGCFSSTSEGPRLPAPPRDAAPEAMAIGAPSAGCGAAPPAAACDSVAAGACSITVNGMPRQYFLALPADYDPQKTYPIVFAWHWSTGTAADLLAPATSYGGSFYGVQPLMPEALYVAAQGLPSTPGGTDYGWANTNGQDVAFALSMLGRIESEYCVDASRVFATGMSYGGEMSDMLGCLEPGVFRAIGVMSGWLYPMGGQTCLNRPVAAWITHGTADPMVDITSGQAARDQFIADDQCDTANTRQVTLDSNTTCTIYDRCLASEGPVVWCPVAAEGHTIPSWAGAELAKFFLQIPPRTADVSSTGQDASVAPDASAAPAPPAPLSVDGGYASAGPLTGPAYTFVSPNPATGTSISPACDGSGTCVPPFGASLCASGTVGQDATYLTVAGAGFDLSSPDSGSAAQTMILPGSELTLAFANPGGSDLRVQLIGDTSGSTFWCYDLAGATSPVTIALSSFNTQCWFGTGAAFVPGTPVAGIQLVVPASASGPVPFDFCLLGVGTF